MNFLQIQIRKNIVLFLLIFAFIVSYSQDNSVLIEADITKDLVYNKQNDFLKSFLTTFFSEDSLDYKKFYSKKILLAVMESERSKSSVQGDLSNLLEDSMLNKIFYGRAQRNRQGINLKTNSKTNVSQIKIRSIKSKKMKCNLETKIKISQYEIEMLFKYNKEIYSFSTSVLYSVNNKWFLLEPEYEITKINE